MSWNHGWMSMDMATIWIDGGVGGRIGGAVELLPHLRECGLRHPAVCRRRRESSLQWLTGLVMLGRGSVLDIINCV